TRGSAMSVAGLTQYEMAHCRSIDELCGLVAERYSLGETTVLLAGGTDWLVDREMAPPIGVKDRPPLVVDVSRLDALRCIEMRGNVPRSGAATTYLELRRSALVRERAPLLERMARDVGAIQIQARGTLGGNVATASPAADGAAALAAFDATTIVRSVRGERRI